MPDTAKIFANIREAKRRMRVARAAGVDLDTADGYQRVHGLAAIMQDVRAQAPDAHWWADRDWDDDPLYESVEVHTGAWAQLRAVARPAEMDALAQLDHQVARLTNDPALDPYADVISTHIALLKTRHPDALALWREALAEVRSGERAIKAAQAQALGVSPAARDTAWGRGALWLWDARHRHYYRNPDWTERVKVAHLTSGAKC